MFPLIFTEGASEASVIVLAETALVIPDLWSRTEDIVVVSPESTPKIYFPDKPSPVSFITLTF